MFIFEMKAFCHTKAKKALSPFYDKNNFYRKRMQDTKGCLKFVLYQKFFFR